MFRFVFALLLLLFGSFASQSQPLPIKFNPVFLDTSIAVIELSLHPDSLSLILSADSAHSDHEYPARFIFRNSMVLDTVENVGLRLRGNTSRNSEKKSFKISFNTFKSGRKWHGLEKLNLNGEHNDPSIIRSKLVWDISNQAGVPSSRAAYARVYINGEYFGLQINVEHVDENFVDDRFGSDKGNLYKCLWPSDLEWLGSSANSWKKMSNGRRIYELMTNKTADDYSGFLAFMKVLHQTPDSIFVREIQRVFNVNAFLKSMAVDVLAGSWDNYWILKNNFYLYHDPSSNRFEWVPYDYDNTLGIWWDVIQNGNIGSRNVYTWGNPNEPRPLMTRIMAQTVFKARYSFFLRQLMNTTYNPTFQNPKIDVIHTKITPWAEADPYRPRDYGFTIQQFHQSYDQALGNHVTFGLKPFIQTRYNSAKTQTSTTAVPPVFVRVTQNLTTVPAGGNLVITARVDAESVLNQIKVFTRQNAQWSEAGLMKDDGIFPDKVAGDREFIFILAAPSNEAFLGYYLKATDSDTRSSIYPDFAPKYPVWIPVSSGLPRLLINELQADNSSTFSDEAGQFDDWVELINADIIPVSTNGWYLTDSRTNENQFQLPDTTLQPGEHLLVWADSDGKQGKWHANFKLAAGGEFIGLYNKTAGGYYAADTLTFPLIPTDNSFARIPDGGGDWQITDQPSPGKKTTVSVEPESSAKATRITLLSAYPNPFNPETTIRVEAFQKEVISVDVFDLTGRRVAVLAENENVSAGISSFILKGDHLASGLYLVRLRSGNRVQSQKVMLLR
ncbi:MAG: CotH kinase family protein [Bacteroidetes bacterium]|nr:CotH kinase family protein [Bacteroidota bacterium]